MEKMRKLENESRLGNISLPVSAPAITGTAERGLAVPAALEEQTSVIAL